MRTMVLALIMLVSTTAFVSDRPNPGPIAYDDEYILLHQVFYVDIPVLDNDVNPGPGNLRVVAVTAGDGVKVDIIDSTTVRVYIDWASVTAWPGPSDHESSGTIAQGTYTVSNRVGQSSATWTVWYWPEVQT